MGRILALIAALGLCGCTTMERVFKPAPSQPTSVQSGALPPPAPYASASPTYSTYGGSAAYAPTLEQSLIDADRRLGAAAQEKGLGPAMVEAADPQASVLTAVGAFRGPEAIQRGLAPTTSYGPIYWQPERASVSAYGDYGSTQGSYVQVLQGAEAVQGKYMTVWRKDSSGRWRVLSNVIVPNARQPGLKKR